MPTWMMGAVVPFVSHGMDSRSKSLTFFTMLCSVVDHVRGGLKSESSSAKSEVVETMVSMRCLRSPSAEVEVAWETSASAAMLYSWSHAWLSPGENHETSSSFGETSIPEKVPCLFILKQ